MRNINAQISGVTGAGKTAFVHYLMDRTDRYVVFDPYDDYAREMGEPFTDFDSASRYLCRYHSDPDLRMILKADTEGIWDNLDDPRSDQTLLMYRAFLNLLLYTQHFHKAPPIGLILEEAYLYTEEGTAREPWPEIASLYRFAGRRAHVSSISTFQQSSDIDPRMRRASRIVVGMMDSSPPTDYLRLFGSDASKLASLQFLQYNTKPILGTHYLTSPAGLDIVQLWTSYFDGGSYERDSEIGTGFQDEEDSDA